MITKTFFSLKLLASTIIFSLQNRNTIISTCILNYYARKISKWKETPVDNENDNDN